MSYDHIDIEKKWQKRWGETNLYKADIKGAKKNFYNLMMFPYPSAEGLHVGNVFAFTGADIYGRYIRFKGFDVFEPMGFDAFGIHSENYAIAAKVHPNKLIPKNVRHFKEDQLKRLGAMFDWDHEVNTTDPKYYKWTQWIFIQLFKAGLAYKKKAPVNWCPSCRTVMANEQIIDGRCERCDSEVEQKDLEQWFFKITAYTKRLLDNLNWIDWSEKIKVAQKAWIGESHGATIVFRTEKGHDIKVFTTRPDTLFGATYMVLSPEHPLVWPLTTPENKSSVEAYQKESKKKSRFERTNLIKEKTGVFLGSYAINPTNNVMIPIWISDYVLMDYGEGAIMAVPAHDQRDWEFAKKFNLPIIEVVESDVGVEKEAYIGDGKMINSGQFNGMDMAAAIDAVTEWLAGKGLASKTITYRLNDWCISRQRYWGPPIPMINCPKCKEVPVPEEDLPVLLPEIENFYPDDSGKTPLMRSEEFLNTKCPKCGGSAKRDTEVSDNFLDSAWYFLRYPSTDFDDRPFDNGITKKWLPVDMYIGGAEHSVLHLMYTRFICMALHDLGLIEFEEPFKQFRAHGTIIKDGAKMSKSRGNIINPDDSMDKYGTDTFRMYLMFLGPYTLGGDFSDKGIIGLRRFLDKVWSLTEIVSPEYNKKVETALHKTIKAVTKDVESLSYNTAIARLMEFVQTARDEEKITKSALERFLILLSPFAPHITEELWETIGNKYSIHNQLWPSHEEALTLDDVIELVVQVNSRVRAKIDVPRGISEEDAVKLASTHPSIEPHIKGKTIRKHIFVKDKLLNIVV